MKQTLTLFFIFILFFIGGFYLTTSNKLMGDKALTNPFFPQTKIQETEQKVSAFLRVKNEIKTIEACLNSIDGVFDRIVIIHSNERDDGSIALMNKWCAKRRYCEIYEYPYYVIPAHDERYNTKNFNPQNSLAAYYNFGLSKFEPEEWVVKIDGDQVYFKEKLKAAITKIKRENTNEKFHAYGIQGYNTVIRGQKLVFMSNKINGGADSFIIKRKMISKFIQNRFYENLIQNKPTDTDQFAVILPGLFWFHFRTMKNETWYGYNRIEEMPDTYFFDLLNEEKNLFNDLIKPYFNSNDKNSYAHLKLD